MEQIGDSAMLPSRKNRTRVGNWRGDGGGIPAPTGRATGMMRTRVYTSAGGGTILADPTMEEIESLLIHPETRLWVDFDAPTEEELQWLERDLGILHLTIEDLARQGQRAKLDEFDSY